MRSDEIAAEALDEGNSRNRHAGRPGQHGTAGSTLNKIANRLVRRHSNFGMAPRAASESNSSRHRNR
jgi:hypothetical protein